MTQTWGYMFNMMIMPRDMLDEYCSWLFPILDQLIKRMGDTEMSDFEKRYPGRISELLFNCYLRAKEEKGELAAGDILEVPFVYTEKINRLSKGVSFLRSKFLGVKQEKSF